MSNNNLSDPAIFLKYSSLGSKIASKIMSEKFKPVDRRDERVDIEWLNVASDPNFLYFVDPKTFLDHYAKLIVDRLSKGSSQDYWILILGEPGSAKSSMSLMLYTKISQYLGKQVTVYNDILRFPKEYLVRIGQKMLSLNIEEMKKGNYQPDVIVLDEAHNMFDVYMNRNDPLVLQANAKVMEVREYKIIHVVNTQSPNQIPTRNLKTRIQNLFIMYKEPVDKGPINQETGKTYMSEVFPNTNYIFFTFVYGPDKVLPVISKLLKIDVEAGLNNPYRLLLRYKPDFITIINPLFGDPELSKAYLDYKEVKLFADQINSILTKYNSPKNVQDFIFALWKLKSLIQEDHPKVQVLKKYISFFEEQGPKGTISYNRMVVDVAKMRKDKNTHLLDFLVYIVFSLSNAKLKYYKEKASPIVVFKVSKAKEKQNTDLLTSSRSKFGSEEEQETTEKVMKDLDILYDRKTKEWIVLYNQDLDILYYRFRDLIKANKNLNLALSDL